MGDVFGETSMIQKILIVLCLMCAAQPAFADGRGYLGVWFTDLPTTEKTVKTGVVVKKVFVGSAGEKAGLKPGEIVAQIDGVSVPDPKAAVALLAENPAGERVWLTVIDRTGGGIQQSNIFAILAASPPSGFASIMTAKPKPPPRRLSPRSPQKERGTSG
jgi:membrane-associated protease RseP (regulator of RpoE activity)